MILTLITRKEMKSNILASLYFISGYITSLFMMYQGKEYYIVFGGITLFFYLTFTLTEALEELDL
jgi:hypothetical protein